MRAALTNLDTRMNAHGDAISHGQQQQSQLVSTQREQSATLSRIELAVYSITSAKDTNLSSVNELTEHIRIIENQAQHNQDKLDIKIEQIKESMTNCQRELQDQLQDISIRNNNSYNKPSENANVNEYKNDWPPSCDSMDNMDRSRYRGADDRGLGHSMRPASVLEHNRDQEPRHEPPGPSSSHGVTQRGNTPLVYSMMLDKPPPFQPDSFATWKRKLDNWRNIHCSAPELSLVGTVMSHIHDPLFERIGNQFMKETKNRLEERTMDNLLAKLEEGFGTRSDVIQFESLKRWQTIKRLPNESYAAFFIKWREGVRLAQDYECLEHPAALYIKCHHALNLSSQHQQVIDMMYKTWKTIHPQKSPSYLELKDWAEGMDAQQKDKGVSFDVLYGTQSGSEIPEEEPSEILLAKPTHAKKNSNKPGTNDLAARNTQKNVNFPNDYAKRDNSHRGDNARPVYRAKLLCFNCGNPDHMEPACPLEHNPQSAFRPAYRRNARPNNDRRPNTTQRPPRSFQINVVCPEDQNPEIEIEQRLDEEGSPYQENNTRDLNEMTEEPNTRCSDNIEPDDQISNEEEYPTKVFYQDLVPPGQITVEGKTENESDQEEIDEFYPTRFIMFIDNCETNPHPSLPIKHEELHLVEPPIGSENNQLITEDQRWLVTTCYQNVNWTKNALPPMIRKLRHATKWISRHNALIPDSSLTIRKLSQTIIHKLVTLRKTILHKLKKQVTLCVQNKLGNNPQDLSKIINNTELHERLVITAELVTQTIRSAIDNIDLTTTSKHELIYQALTEAHNLIKQDYILYQAQALGHATGEQSIPGNIPHIPIPDVCKCTKLSNQTVEHPIIDAGSNVNIVGRDWLKKHIPSGYVHFPHPPVTTSFGGSDILTSNQTALLKIRDKAHKTTIIAHCLVVDAQFPPVLSTPFLQQYSCKIHTADHVLDTNKGPIALTTEEHGLLCLADVWVSTLKTKRDFPIKVTPSASPAHPHASIDRLRRS